MAYAMKMRPLTFDTPMRHLRLLVPLALGIIPSFALAELIFMVANLSS